MKTALIISIFMSFGLLANEVTGTDAENLYNNLKGYEYSSGAITSVMEYRLTVRHDETLECQKEETHYKNDERVETIFTCTLPAKIPSLITLGCTSHDKKISLEFTRNDGSAEISLNDKKLECTSLETGVSSVTCTAIDFETSGAIILKLTADHKAQLEILPAPGSGKILHSEVDCIQL
jgi:hypothetical protein